MSMPCRFSLWILLATALTLITPTITWAAENGRVFMFVRDGSRDLDLMLREEVNVMRQMLEGAGYSVDVATTDGAPLIGQTETLTPTVTLAGVDISRYDGVILPCMAPSPGLPYPDQALELLKQAVAADLPIAASRGSVGAVALVGGLQGHSYSYAGPVDMADRPEFAGASYMGTGFTLDGDLVTAGICPLAARSLGEPDGTVDLTRAFLQALARAD